MSTLPTQLGPYEIIREIARSNDIVYEAFDPRMNRRVAVKELSIPSGSSDPQTQDRIARFEREARAVGMLNHPNIMTVHTTGEDAGRVYMAMEFLDGVSLRKELDTKGTIPMERAVEIALETLDGLAHAHAHGVVHRDIKPDNVQIVSTGQVKITDFGIARLTFQPNLTIDGQVFGTPSYMSPEQVVGKEIDARSDLFSVGVMLYEMLTGVKPFAGDSVVTITYNIVNVSPNPSPQIPHSLWTVITTALDKAPSARYANAHDMRRAVADALDMAKLPPTPAAPWLVGGVNTIPAPPVIAQPTVSPWGTPLGYGQTTPYGTPNPYGAPLPYGANSPYGPQNPYPPNMFPGGGLTAPIYYPAPPRAPILKPETRRALGRFLTILTVLALFFAIAAFALKTIIDTATGASAKVQPRRIEGSNPVASSKPAPVAVAQEGEPTTPVGSRDLTRLDAECRAGGQEECREVLDRLNRGDDGLDHESRLRMGAAALAGSGQREQAVSLMLVEAMARKADGDANARIREALFDAEAYADNEPALIQRVADARRAIEQSS